MSGADLGLGPAGVSLRRRSFRPAGGARETHLCLEVGPGGDFREQCARLDGAYGEALADLGLGRESTVLRRFFLSDPANQEAALLASPLASTGAPFARSIVGQAPLAGGKIALWAYHLDEDGEAPPKRRLGRSLALPRHGGVHLWTADLPLEGEERDLPPAGQTRALFTKYEAELARAGATLAADVLRTWIFVCCIDHHYMDMCAARRDLFAERGLHPGTHYIASTGIAGRRADPRQGILLEGYALQGVEEERIRFLHAPAFLGPTDRYGVTFERGVRVAHGDRVHVLISGTASIDPEGRVLHEGDIRGQTERTFENVGALLAEAGATFADLVQMIVYLRDPADAAFLLPDLAERFPATPYLCVHAPVCRPAWLIEVEAWAVLPAADPGLPPF